MSEIFRRFPLLLSPLSALLWWSANPGGGELWPLACVMLVPLFVAIGYCQSIRQAFLCGLLTGVIHYIFLLYWIVGVIGKFGGLPWFVSILVFILLALFMAAYLGLFAALAYRFAALFAPSLSVWLLPAVWVALDWLRSVLFTGFPWMDPGYALWSQTTLIQVADLLGHHGVTYLLVLLNVVLGQFLLAQSWRKVAITAIGPALLVVAVGVYSVYRNQQVLEEINDARRVRIGLVQGNISQEIKWSKDRVLPTLEEYQRQSISLVADQKVSFIVWPETALPFYPKFNSAAIVLRRFIRENNISLLTGSPWFVALRGDKLKKGDYYNAALLFEPSGKVAGKYFKSHLVPFGEYVPLADVLFFIKPLVEAVGRFSRGEVEQPLSYDGAEVGVLICFESIFPDISRRWVKAGANVLANLTNDAWYGSSSAPHHSLAMTVFRAVETRRSVVRAANTGISGFVDPLGRLAHKSPLFQPWAKSEEVVLLTGESFYVRLGYMFGPLCFVVGLAAAFIALRRLRKNDGDLAVAGG